MHLCIRRPESGQEKLIRGSGAQNRNILARTLSSRLELEVNEVLLLSAIQENDHTQDVSQRPSHYGAGGLPKILNGILTVSPEPFYYYKEHNHHQGNKAIPNSREPGYAEN